MSPPSRPWLRQGTGDDLCTAARDQSWPYVLRGDARERAMPEIDLDLGPRVQPEGAGTDVTSERVQLVGREHASAPRLPTGDPLELPQLLEGIDAYVRVGAHAEGDRPLPDALGGEEAVAQVGFRRRAGAYGRARGCEEIELGAVRVGCVHDGGVLPEASAAREEL